MKTLVLSILAIIALTGCVIRPAPVAVVYEPDVVVGQYYVGYYQPGFGYWTGYGWDLNFYAVGHPGWGHYYRGAPGWAYRGYRAGSHWHAVPRGRWHR